MTAVRIRAGQTVSITTTPDSVSGTFTAEALDPVGRRMTASAEVSGSDVVITIAADEWTDGNAGIGRVELKQVVGSVTSYPYTAILRVLPGIEANGTADGYA